MTISQSSSTPVNCTQYTCAVTGSGATDTIALGASVAVPNLHTQKYYNYDAAGNMVGNEGDSSGTLPTLTTTAEQLSYNCVNELTATAAGGPIRFQASYANPIVSAVVNPSQTLTITGSITNGDVLSLTVHDSTRPQAQTFSYTVNTAVDTSTSLIATHFVSANSSALSAIGVTAAASSNVITLTSSSTNPTVFTETTSASATEILTLGSSQPAAGSISPSDAFVANPTLAGGAGSTSNTASVTAVGGGGTAATNNYSITINSATPATLAYDANGNLTNDGTNAYAWDAENRLVKITYPGSGNNSQFTYDPMSRVVQIQETSGGSVTSTKQFVNCGAAMCEQRDGSGSLSNGKQFFGLGQINFSSGTGTDYFYEQNVRGDIIGVTNSSGTEVASIKYDAYGNATLLAGTNPADFGFTGMYIHQPSGLNLATFRAYSPSLGRWISRDPIGENGGLNLYGYVRNNPISGRDPLGLLVQIGYRDAAGPIAGDAAEHMVVILTPDTPQDFQGISPFQYNSSTNTMMATLAGEPSIANSPPWGPFGQLTKHANDNSDKPCNLKNISTVATPDGMSDTDFINAILNAYNSYENNAPYNPYFPNGRDSANSNSFAAGLITSAGGQVPGAPNIAPGRESPMSFPFTPYSDTFRSAPLLSPW